MRCRGAEPRALRALVAIVAVLIHAAPIATGAQGSLSPPLDLRASPLAIANAYVPPAAAGTPPPGLVTPAPEERWAGPVVFHWFGLPPSPGQFQAVWLPLEGRSAWNGSVAFWTKQERDIIDAGFNFIFFQVASGWEPEMQNHLQANKALLDQGQWAPKIAPEFASESWDCYYCPKDFRTEAGKNASYQVIRNFFNLYFDVLPRERLVTVSGRVLIFLWYVPGCEDADPGIFSYLNGRLMQDFGFTAYWTTHTCWAGYQPDEVNYLFNGVEPFKLGSSRNADLMPGAWRPDDSYPPFVFLARNAGEPYRAAWDQVLASRDALDRVYVESWNEYTEGTGLFEAQPMTHTVGDGHPTTVDLSTCWDNPCHPIEYNDTWGSDPRLYIKISALSAARFLGRLNDAAFVAQAVPSEMYAGRTYSVSVVMRNTGTSTWSRTTDFQLGSQDPRDNASWGPSRIELENGELIAPAQTKTFKFEVRAPPSAGTYVFRWGMLQENVGEFGESSTSVLVTVEPISPPFVWEPLATGAATAVAILLLAFLLRKRKRPKV